nr:transcription termination/antitermination factor NusG [Solirubrobacterales bacterium]
VVEAGAGEPAEAGEPAAADEAPEQDGAAGGEAEEAPAGDKA